MMRVWKGHLYARLDEIMLMLGAELVFFAVGELMFTLVAKTQGLDGSVIPIGTLCALMAAVTIAVFMGIGLIEEALYIQEKIDISVPEPEDGNSI